MTNPNETINTRKEQLLDRLCEIHTLDTEEKAKAKAEIDHILKLVALSFYNAGQHEAKTCGHVTEDYFQAMLKEYAA